jgi:hypothetical protein
MRHGFRWISRHRDRGYFRKSWRAHKYPRLEEQKSFEMMLSIKRECAGGGYNIKKHEGQCFKGWFVRKIKNGYWSGPWTRRHEEDI